MDRRGAIRIGGILAVAGAAAIAGGMSLRADPYRTADALDLKSYLANANGLTGNRYKLRGEVVDSLAISATEGRLIAVRVNEGGALLPVMVTRDFNSLNIEKGQTFLFLVETGKGGLLRTKALSKR